MYLVNYSSTAPKIPNRFSHVINVDYGIYRKEYHRYR